MTLLLLAIILLMAFGVADSADKVWAGRATAMERATVIWFAFLGLCDCIEWALDGPLGEFLAGAIT